MLGAPGSRPGDQGWYNLWISPDLMRASATGAPTRLAFGLEEVWQNELASSRGGRSVDLQGDGAVLQLLGVPHAADRSSPSARTTGLPRRA